MMHISYTFVNEITGNKFFCPLENKMPAFQQPLSPIDKIIISLLHHAISD
jgi:hypothetical protein